MNEKELYEEIILTVDPFLGMDRSPQQLLGLCGMMKFLQIHRECNIQENLANKALSDYLHYRVV